MSYRPYLMGMRGITFALLTAIFLSIGLYSTNGILGQEETESADDQSPERRVAVQVKSEKTARGTSVIYRLSDVTKGDVLYLTATGISGNLDPYIAVAPGDINPVEVRAEYEAGIEEALATGADPLVVAPQLANRAFLAWDDDSGNGYDARIRYTLPETAEYYVVVSSSPMQSTSGYFELTVGLNEPGVLTGEATPTGGTLLTLDQELSQIGIAAQEVTGTLTLDDNETFYILQDVKAGDTVHAYVEAIEGDLKPILLFTDFGDKPIRSGNITGAESSATIQHTFRNTGSNYRLSIRAGEGTEGTFRLQAGINSPKVLNGEAMLTQEPVLKLPIEVSVAVNMEQITGVDQRSENFGVVADVYMDWHDPALAFSADSCQCRFKTFNGGSFSQFAGSNDITWPDYTLFNQQGRRDTQNFVVVVFPNGDATLYERFSATLQAPDFDFRSFPFDVQSFYIRLQSVFPFEFFLYNDDERESTLGAQLGEEEWVIQEFWTETEVRDSRAMFSFAYTATRHLNFYIFRILVPILLIILVAWITFFLRDYSRRIDVTSANLLLFIAFNFTISDELPRLGYLTFLDTILIATFIVSAMMIVLNVYLKRLEVSGRSDRALRIDRIMIWLYPLAYAIGFAIVAYVFLL